MSFNELRNAIFLKYVVSYLIIFLLPLIVLGCMLYQNTLKNLQNEIETSGQNKLIQSKDTLDLLFQGVENIAVRISYDSRLTPFLVRNGEYSSIEAISELAKYKANSGIVDDLLLYFRNDSVVYSPQGLTSLYVLTRDMYRFRDWDNENFYVDINKILQPKVRPAEEINVNKNETRKLLVYSVPIPMNTPYPYATALFLIRESMLTDRIAHVLGDFSGSAFILGDNNELLASKHHGMSFPEDKVRTLLNQYREPGIHSITIDGKRFSMLSVKSQVTGWTFVTVMPTDQFLSKITEIRSTSAIVIFLLIFVGLGGVLLFSANQYRPIRKLAEHAAKRWKSPQPSPILNPIETIRETIQAAQSRQEDLIVQLNAQRPLVRDQFLIKLLKGNLKEPSDMLAVSEIFPQKSQFFVMCLAMIPDAGNVENQETEFLFEEGVSAVYAVELIHEKITALIVALGRQPGVPLSEEVSAIRQKAAAEQISRILSGRLQMDGSIGIGKLCGEIGQINHSFIEALSALEYKFVKPEKSLIFFEDIKNLRVGASWYPVEEQAKLVNSLKQGDRVVALESAESMLDGISRQEHSLIWLKCMCIDLVNTVLKTSMELKLSDFTVRAEDLLELHSFEQFKHLLTETITGICAAVQFKKEQEKHSLIDEILDYIGGHYRSYDLSLESTADRFGLSTAYLSRFIKEQTGMTFTDYVLKLRIEHIKNELVQTVKPIKEIIGETGYMDLPTFTKKFKKRVGITPGQYRKMYSQICAADNPVKIIVESEEVTLIH